MAATTRIPLMVFLALAHVRNICYSYQPGACPYAGACNAYIYEDDMVNGLHTTGISNATGACQKGTFHTG